MSGPSGCVAAAAAVTCHIGKWASDVICSKYTQLVWLSQIGCSGMTYEARTVGE